VAGFYAAQLAWNCSAVDTLAGDLVEAGAHAIELELVQPTAAKRKGH
jgi:hypothetical protein